MNFKEWFKKYTGNQYSYRESEILLEDSWKACKKEVLKILQEDQHKGFDYFDVSIQSKIEKL
ncbi:MAG: hypothetical protein AABY22_29105 [Nanoarchaeota archaeon]